MPNEYLHYYYDTAATVRASHVGGGDPRRVPAPPAGGLLRGDRAGEPLAAWTAALRERDATYMSLEGLGDRDDAEGGGYEQVALDLMRALAADVPSSLILNVRNRGTLDSWTTRPWSRCRAR